MNFTDIREFTYIGNIVIVDGIEIEVNTPLDNKITGVQFHRGNDFLLEEPLNEKVGFNKYQFALDEYANLREVSIGEEVRKVFISELSLDMNNEEYKYYKLDMVDGMYVPDLDRIESVRIKQEQASFRAERNKELLKADIEINKLEDVGGDTTELRVYRQALRDATETWVMPSEPSQA